MSWLNNANTIVGLIVGIIVISCDFFVAATYLLKKAHSTGQASVSSTTSTTQKSSISYTPLSWLEWIEMFGYGLVDTANVVLGLFPIEHETEYMRDIQKIGYCCAICVFGVVVGELILGLTLGIFLGALGMSNPMGATIVVTTILFFVTFSILYIYHVGLRVETKQLEQYQEIRKQSSSR